MDKNSLVQIIMSGLVSGHTDCSLLKIVHSSVLHRWICTSPDFGRAMAPPTGAQALYKVFVAKFLSSSPASSPYFMIHYHH